MAKCSGSAPCERKSTTLNGRDKSLPAGNKVEALTRMDMNRCTVGTTKARDAGQERKT